MRAGLIVVPEPLGYSLWHESWGTRAMVLWCAGMQEAVSMAESGRMGITDAEAAQR